jgi:zinc transporter
VGNSTRAQLSSYFQRLQPHTREGCSNDELLDLRAEHLRTLLTHLSADMDDLEENLQKGGDFHEHESLGRIRIQCSRLRRYFSPELIALHRLLKRLTYWFSDDDKNRLTDDLDLLTYLVQEISSLYGMAKVPQDE